MSQFFATTILVFGSAVSAFGQTNIGQSNQELYALEQPSSMAVPGEFVLCPSRQFYESAIEKGLEKTTFIYYAATMVEAGDKESKVRNLAGREFALPNQLIIPIPKGQKAQVGDIVLSWWQSGSGMQRCIVVGGTESEPVVRYLDIAYDNPSGAGKRGDTLKPDSFYVLSEDWQLGTILSIDTGRQHRVGQLLAKDKQRVLVREFAGKLQVYDRGQARPMPIRPKLLKGDAAVAAVFGSLKPVTVLRTEEKIGRVFAKYQFGRTEKEKAFSFGEIKAEQESANP